MSALIMQTTRTGFFPKKRHCIETQHTNPVVEIKPNDLDKPQQDFGVTEIEVNLIGPERAPYPALTVCRVDLVAQRRRAGSMH